MTNLYDIHLYLGGSKGSKKSFTKGKKSVDGGKKKKGFKDEHGHKKHKKGHHSNARKKVSAALHRCHCVYTINLFYIPVLRFKII